MRKKIIYSEGGARFKSSFEFFLEFFLRFIYKTVKMVSSIAQRIFPNGIDGKTVIKEQQLSSFQKGGGL